jgi:hypothetical protein
VEPPRGTAELIRDGFSAAVLPQDDPAVSVAGSSRDLELRRNLAADTAISSRARSYALPRIAKEDQQQLPGPLNNSDPLSGREVTFAPLASGPTKELQVLAEYDAVVSEVRGTEFTATLRPMWSPMNPLRYDAAFDASDVSPGDSHLLSVGAAFTWTVARERSVDGQVRNIDFIRFQRLPRWTKMEIAAIGERARELEQRYGGGEPNDPT